MFSVRRGAKSGRYVVPVDERLLEIIGVLRDELSELATAEADQRRAKAAAPRPESKLSVREMQSLLRRGRSTAEVARAAGVDEAWVARFAVPVLAEQAQIVRTLRAARFEKQRAGVSGAPIGESVYRNLLDRGVNTPHEELDRQWQAKQLREGVWEVTFRHTWRGREHELVWELDEETGAVRARDRLAAQLSYRPGTRARAKAATKAAPAANSAPKTPSKARPASEAAKAKARAKPVSAASRRVAKARRAATAKLTSEAERATRRDAAIARRAASRPPRRFTRVVPEAVPEPAPEAVPEPVRPRSARELLDEIERLLPAVGISANGDEPQPAPEVKTGPPRGEPRPRAQVEVVIDATPAGAHRPRRTEPLRAPGRPAPRRSLRAR